MYKYHIYIEMRIKKLNVYTIDIIKSPIYVFVYEYNNNNTANNDNV